MGDRKAYLLEAKPIARGGQGEIIGGVRRSDGLRIAMKRCNSAPGSRVRMRREIEVQSTLRHDHVMPVLDWDRERFLWYVMPRGERSLSELTTPIDEPTLRPILVAVLKALDLAHYHDHPHRDVKPSNVIELLQGNGESRWVLADWGMTRRPRGQTTTDLTTTGRFIGTEGYAPPEAYSDAHEIGPRGDLYSLGMLIAWATTGIVPVPNHAPAAPEPWRRLVKLLTRHEVSDRPESAAVVMSMLEANNSSNDSFLLQRAREGDRESGVEVCLRALGRVEDHDFLLDEIPHLDDVADVLVRKHPHETLELVKAIDGAFASFGRRNFDYANTPLRWLHAVAVAAANASNYHLLEDVCDILFPLEASWNRFVQRDTTAAWLSRLAGRSAEVVAECIRTHHQMRTYLGSRVSHAASPAIRDAMRAGVTDPK